MKKDHKIKYLKYSVKSVIGSAVPDKFLFTALLRKDWAKIVGNSVAHHSLPVHVRNDCLTVNVDDPIWVQELTLQKDSIRENILNHFGNPAFGKLFSSVKFRNGDITPPPLAREPGNEPMLLEKGMLERIDKTVGAVDDPDLRQALRKYLIASSLKEGEKTGKSRKDEFDNL